MSGEKREDEKKEQEERKRYLERFDAFSHFIIRRSNRIERKN